MDKNHQPTEKRTNREDDYIDVHSIFETIQGEGPLAGSPAVFIRLAGCNLQCPFCDTDYTAGRQLVTIGSVIDRVEELGHELVVITGGEPMRQNIGALISRLVEEEKVIQIETNGTMFDETIDYESDYLWIVCSPKTPQIHYKLIPHIDAYKYVVELDKVASNGLPTSCLGMHLMPYHPADDFPRSHVYIQPLDSKETEVNTHNTWQAVQSCMNHGYTFCLQVQKIIGMD